MYRALGRVFYGLSVGSIILSLIVWLQRQNRPRGLGRYFFRPNRDAAERRGIFMGLWAPTLAIVGKALDDMEWQSRQVAAKKGASSTDKQGSASIWNRMQASLAGRS